MQRSQLRDAVNSQKFYFRKSVVPEDEEEAKDHPPQSHDHEYTEMSINTIINGKVSTCHTYIETSELKINIMWLSYSLF